MKRNLRSSTIMVGTLAMSLGQFSPVSAASPDAVRGGQSAPVTPDEMLSLYLSSNPGLRTNPAFARDWTAATKCVAWAPIHNDEFRASPFLKASMAELAAGRADPAATYVLRLDRFIDRYDAQRGEFGLKVVTGNDVLPVRVPGFFGEGPQGDGFKLGCKPTSGQLPVEYDVRFDNFGVANGLPMTPDTAAAFAAARTYPNGSRDNKVVVQLKVRLTMGPPTPLGAATPVPGVIVPVTAHIVDVVVEDGTPQRKQLYTLTDAKRQVGDAEGATIAAQAKAEAAVKPLDPAALRAQFAMERAGAKVGPEPFRILVNTSWQRSLQTGRREFRFTMPQSAAYTLGDLSLRFDNIEEVAALSPNAELQARLELGILSETSVVYVPVGAYDDPLKGGQGVIGHILSIDGVDMSTGRGAFL